MKKAIFWTVIFCVIGLFINLIKGILPPFIIAAIFSYLLHPLVQKLDNRTNLSRTTISAIVFLCFIGSVAIGIFVILPIMYHQMTIFIHNIPHYKDYIQCTTIPFLTDKFQTIDPFIAEKIKASLELGFSHLFSILNKLLNNMWSYTMATINVFIILCLVPIILLYFLKEWPKILLTLENLLPLQEKAKILEIFSSINNLLSAYIRGQLNVCLVLALYFSICLYLTNIEPAILLGILSGFMIIIPFLGSFISLSISLIVAYLNFGFNIKLIYVAIIYLVGYIIEGYYLTPKIIGNRIGLHPLWIIFAALAIGSVFGVFGVLFAIPIAGIVKILIHNLIDAYKKSRFYSN